MIFFIRVSREQSHGLKLVTKKGFDILFFDYKSYKLIIHPIAVATILFHNEFKILSHQIYQSSPVKCKIMSKNSSQTTYLNAAGKIMKIFIPYPGEIEFGQRKVAQIPRDIDKSLSR